MIKVRKLNEITTTISASDIDYSIDLKAPYGSMKAEFTLDGDFFEVIISEDLLFLNDHE